MRTRKLSALYKSLYFISAGIALDVVSTYIALSRFDWDFSREASAPFRAIMLQYGFWMSSIIYIASHLLFFFVLWWIFGHILNKFFHINSLDKTFMVISVLFMFNLFLSFFHNLGFINLDTFASYGPRTAIRILFIFVAGLLVLIISERRFKISQISKAVR